MRIFARQAGRTLAAKNAEREHHERIEEARELKAKGYSNYAVARQMGLAESTVRRLMRESE